MRVAQAWLLCVVVWKATPQEGEVSNKKRFQEFGLDANEWSDTDKDEDSRDADCHDHDILQEGCGKGAEEDNASAAAEKRKRASTNNDVKINIVKNSQLLPILTNYCLFLPIRYLPKRSRQPVADDPLLGVGHNR